jgi:hypothetical protein
MAEGKAMEASEKQPMRQFDEKSGLWYVTYWDDALKCFVTELESGQQVIVADSE